MPARDQRRQNCQLIARIKPLNVGDWVRFGVAKLLRLCQSVSVGRAFGLHLPENVVGRPVDNASNSLDPVGLHDLLQANEERDSAANTGLAQKCRVAVTRSSQNSRQVL